MTESEFDPAERDSALIRLVDDEPDVRAALCSRSKAGDA